MESQVRDLSSQVSSLESDSRAERAQLARLQRELDETNTAAGETRRTLGVAQDELASFSEELANLYHHVCVCNNETPSRVTLDFYREGKDSKEDKDRKDRKEEKTDGTGSTKETPASPGSASVRDSRKEPMGVCVLAAMIREQMRHLQQAVERGTQLARQRLAPLELAAVPDKEQAACMEEIFKLRSLLSTKREQIATLRAVLKANKQVKRHDKSSQGHAEVFFSIKITFCEYYIINTVCSSQTYREKLQQSRKPADSFYSSTDHHCLYEFYRICTTFIFCRRLRSPSPT